MSAGNDLAHLQEKLWHGSVPLQIRLAPDTCRTFDDSHIYMITWPRLSYLPSLLQRLHDFFSDVLINPQAAPTDGWLSFEGVPLKWQHPMGLLYDLFSRALPTSSLALEEQPWEGSRQHKQALPSAQEATLPWRLTLHYGDWPTSLIRLSPDGRVHHDAFINSVKEADHLRNGTAKTIMSMSLEDGTALWRAVETHDLQLFKSVNDKLLKPTNGTPLRHVPIKVYLPIASSSHGGQSGSVLPVRGSLKVVQMPISATISAKEEQTLGTALHSMLPGVFPSRRSYIHARAVLHGAVLPLSAPMTELMQAAAYCDGFLHVSVVMVA